MILGEAMRDRKPITHLERGIIAKLAGANFPPGTASKRFARALADGNIQHLSDKGRRFLAFVVHRFRRQYTLTAEEQTWLSFWMQPEPPAPLPPSLTRQIDSLPSAELPASLQEAE